MSNYNFENINTHRFGSELQGSADCLGAFFVRIRRITGPVYVTSQSCPPGRHQIVPSSEDHLICTRQ
jgi:hypothetical protein